MARSQEEKSHTNGAQEIPKSVNRWNLCLPTVSRRNRPNFGIPDLGFRVLGKQFSRQTFTTAISLAVRRVKNSQIA